MFLSANPGRPPPTHGVAARPGENRNNLGLCPSPKSRWGWRSRARLRDTQGHLPCRGTTREGLRLARRGPRRGPGGVLVRRVRGTQPSQLGSRCLPSAPQVQDRPCASPGPGTRPSGPGSPQPAPGARPPQARGHPRPASARVLTLFSGGISHLKESHTRTHSDSSPQSDATAARKSRPALG